MPLVLPPARARCTEHAPTSVGNPGPGKEVVKLTDSELLTVVVGLLALLISAIRLGLAIGKRDRD